MASFADARCVVEFGAGTGVYTEETLGRLRPDARFLAFEIDPDLHTGLAARLHDPRLELINDSAERVRYYLGDARADVLISSLPYTSLPSAVRERVLGEAVEALTGEGVLLVLQYSPYVYRALRERFGSVQRRVSLLNVPPAYLFACRSPRRPAPSRTG